jgi:hypothetical protein
MTVMCLSQKRLGKVDWYRRAWYDFLLLGYVTWTEPMSSNIHSKSRPNLSNHRHHGDQSLGLTDWRLRNELRRRQQKMAMIESGHEWTEMTTNQSSKVGIL